MERREGASIDRPAGFPDELVRALEAKTALYPRARGALLPILHELQARRGHLEPDDLRLAASLTGISAAEAVSVASFYTMFRMRPAGRFPIGVCRNRSSSPRSTASIAAALRDELGAGPGQASADGLFSLQEVECLGSCGTAPCLEIDSRYFEELTPDSARDLVRRLRASTGDPAAAVIALQEGR
jgi:NADH-quinone oxidoreductase subunit E